MPAAQEHVCSETVYDQIFDRVAPVLRNFLYYRCGDLERAGDLVQEAFIKLWEQCQRVTPQAAQAFLFKVAGNLLINLAQKDKVRLNFQRLDHPQADQRSPQHELEYAEYAGQVGRAIDSLPTGQREVFLMNRIDKLTYGQIATALGISVKAVEKRMHKALVKLRDVIHGL